MNRIIIKGGLVIDPSQGINEVQDILIDADRICDMRKEIIPEDGDRVISCEGLEVWPGLIDMHLHVADLFEIHTATPYGAVEDGVTTALSPGAGNTLMSPALLGAEVDRGLPLNAGVYLGALNVLGTQLSDEELIALFHGKLESGKKAEKLSHNRVTNETAQYCIGIKEHMGHFLLSDTWIERLYHITSEAGLVFMSHTQDPFHTSHLVDMAKGREIHLGHTNAAGCGTHAEPEAGIKQVIDLCQKENVTGEFVTTMLRKGLGSREGLQMTKGSRELALEAVREGIIDILVSDGQNQSTMKGFGDTRDNIPCILELTEEGVLDRSAAVAMMTKNPADYLGRITGCREWTECYGTLKKHAYANLAVVDPNDKLATYVMTNGQLTSFENRFIRGHGYAGNWVSRFGTTKLKIGDASIYSI
ncbi:amidohydrolase family protein [Hespellia stercorisuis]|uniref:Dihydroorotase n=1 Tax=Hespellia stercorisuis DSM 15480 TaxID=1121950 RepID=A0A1M6QK05_9FIRM|nr:amidohydrolase family protein [Hespellia stercorisuis]SHK20546.1 Dihydroorotase [Hespellia stercorisuis DSM 15480]